MIVCDKCASLIEEKPPEEDKSTEEVPKDEDGKKRGFKKALPKEEPPMKRPSLVNLPYKYGLNCFERKDFDLCEECRRFLEKELDKVKFNFITKEAACNGAERILE